jgi:hypothetical protein
MTDPIASSDLIHASQASKQFEAGGATDGQTLIVSSTQTVTALTVNGNTGQTVMNAPTTIAAGTAFKYKYNATTTKWYRQ